MKKDLVAQLVAHLEGELSSLQDAVDSAEEAATHEEAKPENKYDTRGLEASYLAGAQRERVAELESSLALVKAMVVRTFDDATPIALTALIEYEVDGLRNLCFLTPAGAGYRLTFGEQTVITITTHSPLGRALLGKRAGDTVTLQAGGSERDYDVRSVK